MTTKQKHIYCVTKAKYNDTWEIYLSALSQHYNQNESTVKTFNGVEELPEAFKNLVMLYLASERKEEGEFCGVGYESLEEFTSRDGVERDLWLRLTFNEKQYY